MPNPSEVRSPTSRGSVLLLFPAAVLIVMVLAALAVDLSIAYLGERELANATAAAANDAATQAVSDAAFYRSGQVQLDPAKTRELATERVRQALDPARYRSLRIEVRAVVPSSAGCPWRVSVRATARVDYIFSKAVPGGPDRAEVSATSIASPRQDAGPSCG